MKKPAIPPIFKKESLSPDMINVAFYADITYKGEYFHWDELRYKQPRPENLSAEQWWMTAKLARIILKPYQLPLKDYHNNSFNFIMPNILLPKLALIDRKGSTYLPSSIARERYVVDSLIEESITSSQLEGALTTRRVAKDMLLSQRKPINDSERMIFNNYAAMKFIQENKSRELSMEFILEIHRILMKDLLADAGSLRLKDNVHVVNQEGEILYTPPKAKELKKRLETLCNFANQDETEEKYYIHPVIKAIILHFSLAYEHPFSDGNGRTARALFYWFMLNRGYWLIEYISISKIIKQAPNQYGMAFLYTETDDNDVTYFIFHQIKVILKAIDVLYKYLEKETQELAQIETLLHRHKALNYRQLALLKHALKNPGTHYFIASHKEANNITYQTARTDLLQLEKLKFLTRTHIGKAFVFIAAKNLKNHVVGATSGSPLR